MAVHAGDFRVRRWFAQPERSEEERLKISPEMELLAQSCAYAFAAASAPRPSGEPDWHLVLALAKRHRVQGLLWRALQDQKDVPPWAAAEMSRQAQRIAEHGLRTAAESARIRHAFASREISLLFLKGLPVGKLAYGNPFLKLSWDIDLLVPPEEIGVAAALLAELGYTPSIPARVEAVEAWHRRSKESVWQGTQELVVELHGRVADHPAVLPSLNASSPAQQVDVAPGITLPTFARDEQFAYLAVHGASSAWFRLKWLSDFAALIAGCSADEIERLHARSQDLGAGRAPGLALLLSERLFGTELGARLHRTLRKSQALRTLQAIALSQLCSVREPTDRRFGTLGIHAGQLLLLPGARFAGSEFLRQVREVAVRS